MHMFQTAGPSTEPAAARAREPGPRGRAPPLRAQGGLRDRPVPAERHREAGLPRRLHGKKAAEDRAHCQLFNDRR